MCDILGLLFYFFILIIMQNPKKSRLENKGGFATKTCGLIFIFFVIIYFLNIFGIISVKQEADFVWSKETALLSNELEGIEILPTRPELDTEDYLKRLFKLAHIDYLTESETVNLHKERTQDFVPKGTTTPVTHLWPPNKELPLGGALLPFNRIIAYYGNFYSTKMGALGQYPEDEMIERLKKEVALWEEADPETPVLPAIHYIAVTAQNTPQPDGKYRLRMPDSQIDIALNLAERVGGIVFLDIQVGLSDIQEELPLLEKYLKLRNVHLGIDPEFYMKTGAKPGTVIGTMDADDVNYATEYLARLVNEYNLPPKILVIHRFTKNMLRNYKNIEIRPETQIVIHMDGWGSPQLKFNTYKTVIYPEPVQFTGFKLFYRHDTLPPSTHMLSPKEILELLPRPIYIQYQ